MRLSDLKAGTGTKQTLLLPVTSPYPIQMTVICGNHPGKTLVVTAGVHGCEYVGIEALRSLGNELEPDNLSGRLILLPLVNPEGFYHGAKQIIPSDGQNLNRMFPGSKKETFSSQLAKVLEETLYPEADFLMDLHGGDVNEALTPLIFFPTAVPEKLATQSALAAAALSVPYRVASTSKNGLYSWAAQCGIPALLVERGERGLWSKEEVTACKHNVYEMMEHLGMLSVSQATDNQQEQTSLRTKAFSRPTEINDSLSAEAHSEQTEVRDALYAEAPSEQTEIRETLYAEAPSDGFWYPAMKKAGKTVPKGALLGTLNDVSGKEIFRCIAPFDGVILYFTLSLGVKSEDPLVAFGRLEHI